MASGTSERHGGPPGLFTVVMIAGAMLLVLKGADMLLSGGFTATSITRAQAQEKPEAADKAETQVKLDAGAKGAEGAPADKMAADGEGADKMSAGGGEVMAADEAAKAAEEEKFLSRSERAILQSLSTRRKALDERERAIDLKEKLLAATKKQIETRIKELKGIETRIEQSFVKEEQRKTEKLRDIVTLYENMKSKDAARIFNRLDMNVLVNVAGSIKPRKMANILADMNADVAERLTIELAAGASRDRTAGELPSLAERGNP